MKDDMRAAKQTQRHGIGNKLITPEMRQQILDISYELEDCKDRVAGQLEILSNMRAALGIARQSARCLLTNDPFAAWEKIEQRRNQEFDAICGPFTRKKQNTTSASKATAGAERLITRQMRQQIVDAKKEIANYARVLTEFLDDVAKLESHNIAMEWADGLKCRKPLESGGGA